MFPYHRSPSPQPVGRIRMWTLAFGVTFGFLAFSKSDPVPELSRGCSFMGVFHVEGRSRYSLTFKQAKQLCLHLSATLPDKEQIIKAYEAGMETCRYGWIDNRTVVILRHTSHSNCASNLTGAIFYDDEVSDMQYDAYCYNKSDLLKKNCDLVVRPLKPESSSTIPDYSFTTDTPGGLFTLDPSPAIVYPTDTSDPRPVSSVTTAAEQTMETTPGIIEPTAQSNSGEAPDTHKKQNLPVKEWVIILIVILAVALILLVCFAVSFRKSLCGKHAVLTIASEEPSESKAATAKRQEMVTLINEEGVQKNSSVEESKFITTSTKKERVA